MGITDAELDSRKAKLSVAARKKLETYSIDAQKRWVVNPVMERLTQNFTDRLMEGLRAAARVPAKPKPTPVTPVTPVTPAPTPDEDSGSENMFDLFGADSDADSDSEQKKKKKDSSSD